MDLSALSETTLANVEHTEATQQSVFEPQSLTRRSLLGTLLNGLALGRFGRLPDVDEPLTLIWDGSNVGLEGGYVALETWTTAQWRQLGTEERPDDAAHVPGLGWLRIRRASRSEALEAAPGPDPEPVEIEILGEGRFGTLLRYWNPGDPQACRRCDRCNACAAADRPGLDICMVPLRLNQHSDIHAATKALNMPGVERATATSSVPGLIARSHIEEPIRQDQAPALV